MSILTIILAFLPGFAWLFFYLQEDPHPEPKRLIFLTFIAGALSAIAAFFLQVLIHGAGIDGKIAVLGFPHAGAIIMLLAFAAIEEIAKFGGAYFAIHKNRNFDEPTDAMIYMIVAALGFATVENIGVLYGGGGEESALWGAALQTISFRFVGATLLHTISSGLVGYSWAKTIRNFGSKKWLVGGLIAASVLHMVFNYLILIYGNL
ncbi:MAG: PrsW family glutamic-type intramembrane protease, partial [bacterium]|nr:PrsW family glutamic-type intramembrane protease [bacterium]